MLSANQLGEFLHAYYYAINRCCLALHYHMRYASVVTESHVKYTLTIVWLVNFLLSGFGFWYPRVHRFVAAIVTIIFHLICIALLSEFIFLFVDIS